MLLLLPLATGCTAMGAWVYDDPSFALRTVTVRRGADMGAGASDSLELLFLGCNRNDYDLMSDGFTARLALSGRTVAEGMREQPVFLGTRDTSSFVIVMPLQPSDLGAPNLVLPFELNGTGVVHTPIGNRPVRFQLRGRVDSHGTGMRWLGEGAVPCRPGLSQLPGIFDRRVPAAGEDSTPPARRPLYPNDPNGPTVPGPGQQPGQGGRP